VNMYVGLVSMSVNFIVSCMVVSSVLSMFCSPSNMRDSFVIFSFLYNHILLYHLVHLVLVVLVVRRTHLCKSY
jgi:hypothetical protein